MATKNYNLSLNDKQASFTGDSSTTVQYNSLNLNHNNERLSEVIESSKSFTSDSRKEDRYDLTTDSQKNGKDNFRDKFMNGFPSNFLEQVYPGQKENCRKGFGHKEKNSNKSNNSTLSLHIAAYEKSVEGIRDPNNSNANVVIKTNKEQKGLIKDWKSTKHLLKDSTSNMKNSFEYPRQQKENDANDPEVMQFKASQQLLNPNQSTTNSDLPGRANNMPRSSTAIDESPLKRQFSESLTESDRAEDEAIQPPRRRKRHPVKHEDVEEEIENDENQPASDGEEFMVDDVDENGDESEDDAEDLPSTSVLSQRRRSRRSVEEVEDLSRTLDVIDIEDVIVAGQVKEVELENFMCHSNLKMRFDTDKFNCFYIVGPNGSGKSAIFAGLNIGLGGKGRSNNRGNSLSSYIKEGEASAKIRVHLSNTGANKHALYDEEIVIERIIRQTSTTYSLKSLDKFGKMRVVSTAKKDLDNILKRFSIELENPLCWLSQDRAREFLQEMKPNKLYEIFMITSELCIVNRYHETTADHLQDMQKLLDNWKEKQKDMKENFEKLKRIAEATEKIRLAERELSKYNWIALWIPMKNNVLKVEAIEKTVVNLEKEIEKCQKKIEGRDNGAVELRTSMEAMQQRFDEGANEISTNRTEILKLKRAQTEDSFKTKQIANRVAAARTKIRNTDFEIREANKTLESVLGRADRDIIGEKAALQGKVTEAQVKLDQLNEQKNTISQEKMVVESQRREIFENLQDCDANIRNFKNEISKVDRNQRERERIAKDKMARFGRDTTDILKYLDQYASKFTKRPIGPIGMHVQVHDKKWENGIEFLLKNNLHHYLCDNAKDRKVFDNMLAHHKIQQVPVAVVQFSDRKYNTSAAEPHHSVLTVAREAIIEDATVYNYLVDVMHIESVMLIERDDEGREIMSQNPPHNVSKAITERTAEIYPVKHDRPYRFYAGRGYRARVLGDVTNIEDDMSDDQKRYFEEQIREAEKQKAELSREENKIREKASNCSKELQTISIEFNKLERNISNFETEMRKLDSIASRETLINDARATLDGLNRMKEKDEELLQQILQEQNENEEIYNQKGRQIQEIVDRNKDLAAQLKNVEDEVEKLRRDFDNFDNATEKFRSTIRNNERQIAKQNEHKERLLQERDAIDANIVNNASKYEKPENMTDPPDYDTLIDKETCEKKISKKKAEIISLTRLNEGQHVTEEELEAAKKAYEKASSQEKVCATQLRKVNKAFLAREELFQRVKEEIPIKLRKKFCELMAMRNYIGDLIVDHEAEKIEISVQTHKDAKKSRLNNDAPLSDGDEDAAGRRLSVAAAAKKRVQSIAQDLKGLSGGERSYTTACFVMALWSCVESPFRCLDEFDVFMDMVNRRIIMELLSDLARKHRHIQFFFFTPQGISELQANDVEVFTMAKARP